MGKTQTGARVDKDVIADYGLRIARSKGLHAVNRVAVAKALSAAGYRASPATISYHCGSADGLLCLVVARGVQIGHSRLLAEAAVLRYGCVTSQYAAPAIKLALRKVAASYA